MNSFQLPDGYGYATAFSPSAVLMVARMVVELKSNAWVGFVPHFTDTV